MKRTPMVVLLMVMVATMAAVLPAGCGGSDAETDTTAAPAQAVTTAAAPAAETTVPTAASETTTTAAGGEAEAPAEGESSITRAEDLSPSIVLPAGFAIEDAVTTADLERVTGKTGWTTFPRPESSPSKGRPEVDFRLGDDQTSRINFLVYATDGRAKYDTSLKFVTNPEEVAADLWDKLIVGDAQSGGDVTTLVLRNDVCMRITWNGDYYSEFDRLDLGVRLADMLVAGLFKER